MRSSSEDLGAGSGGAAWSAARAAATPWRPSERVFWSRRRKLDGSGLTLMSAGWLRRIAVVVVMNPVSGGGMTKRGEIREEISKISKKYLNLWSWLSGSPGPVRVAGAKTRCSTAKIVGNQSRTAANRAIAAALSSGSLPFPHLGDCTHDGHPLAQEQPRSAASVAARWRGPAS